jgi:hypothetical protein
MLVFCGRELRKRVLQPVLFQRRQPPLKCISLGRLLGFD